MLDSLMPQPASIQKPNFDIVAWNDSFCRLMGIDFATSRKKIATAFIYLTHETGAAGSKIAMCCRPSSLFPRRDGRAPRRSGGKTNWRAFSPPVGV